MGFTSPIGINASMYVQIGHEKTLLYILLLEVIRSRRGVYIPQINYTVRKTEAWKYGALTRT